MSKNLLLPKKSLEQALNHLREINSMEAYQNISDACEKIKLLPDHRKVIMDAFTKWSGGNYHKNLTAAIEWINCVHNDI